MNIRGLPQTNMDRLREEILNKDPSAALPVNMSSKWLSLIERDLKVVFEGGLPESMDSLTCGAPPAALVLQVLSGKSGSRQCLSDMPDDILLQLLLFYLAEVALELSSRLNGFEIEHATLETIFTDRKVLVSHLYRGGTH